MFAFIQSSCLMSVKDEVHFVSEIFIDFCECRHRTENKNIDLVPLLVHKVIAETMKTLQC